MSLLQCHQERHGPFTPASRNSLNINTPPTLGSLCAIRSLHMNNVAANRSQLMKVLVHQVIRTGQTGIQLQEPKGMPQPMPYKRLYMRIGFWIMDGAAHKYCFSIKGDSGSRFCNLCKNVLVSSFTKANQLDFTEDAEIWTSWSRMTARMSTELLENGNRPQESHTGAMLFWLTLAGQLFVP